MMSPETPIGKLDYNPSKIYNKEGMLKELTERSCENCAVMGGDECLTCKFNRLRVDNWSPKLPTKYKRVFEITTSKPLNSSALGNALESYLPSMMPCDIREVKKDDKYESYKG